MKTILKIMILSLGLTSGALAVEVGEPAQCVVLENIQQDGSSKDHCIRDRKENQTHTILEFFSISCPACQENLPKITTLALSVVEQATTRLISVDRKEEDVKTYIAQNKAYLPFEIALDSSRDAKRAYDVIATPTLFVLDASHTVIYKHTGVLEAADIIKIQKLIRGY